MLSLKWDIESRIDSVPIWIIHGNSIGLCHSFYGFYHVFVVEFDLLSCISLMKYWINPKMYEFYIYRFIEWLHIDGSTCSGWLDETFTFLHYIEEMIFRRM